MVLIVLGVIVSTVALVLGSWLGFWIGVVVVALGAIAGGVLKVAGFGKPRSHTDAH